MCVALHFRWDAGKSVRLMGLAKSLRRFPGVALWNRFWTAWSYQRAPFWSVFRWTLSSRETTNFTYDLEPLNRQQLAAFIAHFSGVAVEKIFGYFEELENDAALKEHIARVTLENKKLRRAADTQARFGRRIGWYALVRARKPQIVVETGVDKGLGSCVLCAALLLNRSEGSPGTYYGTDINPRAGALLCGPYAETGKILYGDSLESLAKLSEPVDLFINDSDHSAEYEAREYALIESKLSPDALVLGDNAHVTPMLQEFAQHTGRGFLFFKEVPSKHWYPGGGIGVAFKR